MDLKEHRKNARLTQSTLSELCECGRTTICMIENGKLRPSVKLAKRIGNVLGVDWTLFYADEEEREYEEDNTGHDGRGPGSTSANDQSRPAARGF